MAASERVALWACMPLGALAACETSTRTGDHLADLGGLQRADTGADGGTGGNDGADAQVGGGEGPVGGAASSDALAPRSDGRLASDGAGSGDPDGSMNPPATDASMNPPATDASMNPPTSDGSLNPPATDASVNPPAADGGSPPVDDPHAAGPLGAVATTARVDMPGGGALPRQIDVFVQRPEDPSGAPYPLLVFSHGFQASGNDYASFAERLASHGFVVVSPTYDNFLGTRDHAQLAGDVVTIIDWALAQGDVPGSELFQQVDPARIGAAGHSRGGKQSFFAALEDPRIGAVFGLDPVDSGPPFGDDPVRYPSLTPERVGELSIPTAVVGSERGPEGAVACAPGDDNWDDYFAATPSPSYAYLVSGSGHMDFMDACGLLCFACTGGDDAEFTREVSREAMVAFFRRFLNGEVAYQPYLDGEPARADPRVQVQSR